MKVESFFDGYTFTYTYIVYDEKSLDCVIIDPVSDYQINRSTLSYESADKLAKFIDEKNLRVHLLLETHIHADHFTAAGYLKTKYPSASICISDQVTGVQDIFTGLYNLKLDCEKDSQFDILVKDGQTLEAGSVTVKAIHTPGHTPACVSYLIGGDLFTGDTLFMPDQGTGRCDFPNGSAEQLYDSITELYKYRDDTKIYVGHDYGPGGRDYKCLSTIGESKKDNTMMPAGKSKDQFIEDREKKDGGLDYPRLLFPCIQVNMVAGKLPDAEDNGMIYLKLPLTIK
ncbi:MAG: MBL fold metallo-hydrolase [Bacteriovoracaceae bacterium]|nr:MBL fold metallo-hydrolase [Bacteriovoracaceae bacterium]